MINFLDKIKEQTSKNIGVDFDGVIHKNSKGFHDGTIYDDPVDGAKEALEFLSKKYNLILFTCKANPERPLVNGKSGKQLVQEWLEKYDFAKYITEITDKKPRAWFYIDDKSIRFYNWESTLDFIAGEEK